MMNPLETTCSEEVAMRIKVMLDQNLHSLHAEIYAFALEDIASFA